MEELQKVLVTRVGEQLKAEKPNVQYLDALNKLRKLRKKKMKIKKCPFCGLSPEKDETTGCHIHPENDCCLANYVIYPDEVEDWDIRDYSNIIEMLEGMREDELGEYYSTVHNSILDEIIEKIKEETK